MTGIAVASSLWHHRCGIIAVAVASSLWLWHLRCYLRRTAYTYHTLTRPCSAPPLRAYTYHTLTRPCAASPGSIHISYTHTSLRRSCYRHHRCGCDRYCCGIIAVASSLWLRHHRCGCGIIAVTGTIAVAVASSLWLWHHRSAAAPHTSLRRFAAAPDSIHISYTHTSLRRSAGQHTHIIHSHVPAPLRSAAAHIHISYTMGLYISVPRGRQIDIGGIGMQ